MSRIHQTDPATVTGSLAEMFAAVKGEYGKVPNGLQVLATSEETLGGYMAFASGVREGKLGAAEREQIAIAVAAYNGCRYCLSGHTLAARVEGVSEEDRVAAQRFEASEARPAAVLAYTKAVLESRGGVADEDLDSARGAGLTDGELIEIIAEITINTFSNYLYRLSDPKLDFPAVEAVVDAAV